MRKKYELSKMVDSDKLIGFQKVDQFLEFINQEPPRSWLEEHPMAIGVHYLPIGMVELLLTKIFQQWRVEVLREGQILNSIYCTVRLHYKHPVTGDWDFQDGVAAVPAKTDKGAKASDMSAIKSEAVMTGLPAAESFAVKDAADKIGKIFGRDINRKGNLSFNASYKDSEEDLRLEIAAAESTADLGAILDKIPAAEQKHYAPLVQKRINELKAHE